MKKINNHEVRFLEDLKKYGQIYIRKPHWKCKVYGAYDWGKGDRRFTAKLLDARLIKAIKNKPAGTVYEATECLLDFFKQSKNLSDFTRFYERIKISHGKYS